jgi:hypothetical protein
MGAATPQETPLKGLTPLAFKHRHKMALNLIYLDEHR